MVSYYRSKFLGLAPFIIITFLSSILQLTAQLPDGFVRQEIADQLNPAKMAMAPDGRIFITEKDGIVKILRDDVLLPDPFLQIEVDHSNERGLTGIAFDPNFNTNNYIYFYYAVPGKNFNRISRFTANGNLAIPGSEQILFELDQMHGDIHNGGSMNFGFDGKLYIFSGDSGIGWWAAHKDFLLGKVLRLNSDGTIPEDNPYYNVYEGKYRAIYAAGLRNPFSSAMHPITGLIYFNDVGQSTWEEINKVEKGAFYGWGTVEGFLNGQDVPGNYKDPEYAYQHTSGSCAIVGSTIYEPEISTFPEKYWGKYFFNDYCTGEMRVFDLEKKTLQEVFMTGGNRMIEILTHSNGNIYYLERRGRADGSPQDNSGTNEGALMKIIYTGSGAPFISVQPKDDYVVEGEPATFSTIAFGAESLTYQWFKNGIEISNANSDTFKIAATTFADSNSIIQVRIKNSEGDVFSSEAKLRVTKNKRPIPIIISPENETIYTAGSSIQFAGNASDPETGNVELDNLWWKVDFYHNEHVHPAMPLTKGMSSGTFNIPEIGEISTNVFYRIYLIAEDDFGLRQTSYVDIFPKIVHNRFTTYPPNLKLSKDGVFKSAPVNIESVEGISRTIEAPLKQERFDSIYIFKNWSSGEESNYFTYSAGENLENTAIYKPVLKGLGDGLTASYFGNAELEGEPLLIRQDSVIDYQFFNESAFEGLPEDYFSIRWEGFILPYVSGEHIFQTQSDDGVRLWVNDELILENWTGGGHSEQGVITLEANRLYPITFEYQEILYAANVRLRWATEQFSSEIIPQSQMYRRAFVDKNIGQALVLAPNPAKSFTTLLVKNSNQRINVDVVVTDLFGRIVMEFKSRIEYGTNTVKINLDEFSAGSYYISIRDEQNNEIISQLLMLQ